MNCHIIMDAYVVAYVDNEVGIPAHLLTAQDQRFTIFLAFFSPLSSYFQPF
jgi:hypothetical protein